MPYITFIWESSSEKLKTDEVQVLPEAYSMWFPITVFYNQFCLHKYFFLELALLETDFYFQK